MKSTFHTNMVSQCTDYSILFKTSRRKKAIVSTLFSFLLLLYNLIVERTK